MNYKQKLGYMALGAGIMLVGLTVGAIVSPPLIAHGGPADLGVFGKVVCRKIEVVNEHDQTMIRLESDPSGSLVTVYNKAGEAAMSLQTSPNGKLSADLRPSGGQNGDYSRKR